MLKERISPQRHDNSMLISSGMPTNIGAIWYAFSVLNGVPHKRLDKASYEL